MGVVVNDEHHPVGILTKMDIVDHLSSARSSS